MTQAPYNATVEERRQLAPGLFVLFIQLDAPLMAIKPGQYTTLGLYEEGNPAKLVQRAYSIASFDTKANILEFYLVMVDEGRLSPRLDLLRESDRLMVGKKATGIFTLESVPPDSDLILIGTGTGLAPYICMVRQEFNPKEPRKWVIIHGVRHSFELAYHQELEALERANKNFIYIPSVTRATPEENWLGHMGRVQTVVENGALQARMGVDLTPRNQHVFLCGNPDMIRNMQGLLEQEGFSLHRSKEPGNIHIEEYW